MNDEKRRNARLQGRFSDEPKPSRKEKSKRKSDEATSKRKSLEPKLQPGDGIEVQYDENAKDTFSQLEEKKPPVEINEPGEHILSITENGTSRILFEPDFLPTHEADHWMDLLNGSTTWYDKNIIIHGQEVPQPRLVAWYGPFPYSYSGAVLEAAEMPPAILEIKQRVERYLEAHNLHVKLNSVLLNKYRDGKDSVAWHSDDELIFDVNPTIASVSLGEMRKFQMKIKQNACENVENLVSEEYFVNLTPGSLIIMDGCMQQDWKHQVPKEYHDKLPRINLTFRTVYPIEKVSPKVPWKTVENSNHNPSSKIEAKCHIFDNTNFPSLESANSQDGNSSKVAKNSSTNSKSKTADVEASISYQNYSDDSMQQDSSQNSNTSDNQELKNESHDASPEVVDSDYQKDALKEPNRSSKYESTGAFGGTSDTEHPNPDSNQASKRYELNANANEFIPSFSMPNEQLSSLSPEYYKQPLTKSESSEYYKQPLIKLPEFFRSNKVPPSRFEEFFNVVIEKLECNSEFLMDRDHYEVETLAQLYRNGLCERNQEIVLTRLCSMIRNAAKKQNRPYRPAPPRSGYRNTYSRSRGPYRGSSSREKD